MKVYKNRLGLAIRAAFVMGAGFVATAYAQDANPAGDTATTQSAAQGGGQAAPDSKQAKQLEAVTVTGSRIRRVDVETVNPVVTIDRAQIERTGKVTLGDLVQQLPEIAGAATNPTVNNGGGDGASTVSLRGLGSQRTLLLLDGHRLAYQDLNSIPLAMIERVEVLKDGASTIYGSDAIGGVVNFITRKNFQGAQFNVDYGLSDHGGDGKRRGFSAVFGQNGEKGNISVGVNYNKQDAISAGRRDFSKVALYNDFGDIFAQGSSNIPGGRYDLPPGVAAALGFNCSKLTRIDGRPGTSPSDFRCYKGSGPGNDTYNYAPYNLEMTPAERGGIFVNGNYDFSDKVQAYFTGFTQKTRSNYELAPLPLLFTEIGAPLSKNSIYNPFGVDISSGGWRDVVGGDRLGKYSTQADQMNMGFRGQFGQSTWQWDAGVVWARTTQKSSFTGYYYNAGLAQAVGPSFYDNGVPTCGTPSNPISNCVPVNLFNPQTSADALAKLRVTPSSQSYASEKTAYATANGELFNLPAGAVSASIGAEYRKDTSSLTPDFVSLITDPEAGTCLTSTDACRAAQSGSTNVKELYGELFVPLLADQPFVKSMNITLGGRYSKFSKAGSTKNGRVGFEYRPVDDLLIRGTVDQVFRAPTISDLFGGVTPSSDTYKDPCSGAGYAAGNPACAGASPGFVQGQSQTRSLYGSNSSLKPEHGRSISWGFVYDPHYIEGLSLSADLWRIYLKDTIGNIGTQTIIDQCYNFSRYCGLITRNPVNGEIDTVNNTEQNVGRLDVSGIDFGVRYKLPEFSFGTFVVTLDTTYLKEYNREAIAGDLSSKYKFAGTYYASANGGDGNFARLRGLLGVQWSLGDFDASIRTRYVSRVRFGDIVATPSGYSTIAQASDPDTGVQSFHAGAYAKTDLQFGYQTPWNFRLDVGIDNAFDKKPPMLWQYGFNGNTDERTYDTVGRYYWTRISMKF
ncbi:TonB-dependent receptor plug domain-containing protein [Aerosticca soli]|uniref:TonB-dependent receptor n=1 Tax=Aerosticca soli TaxID=2010829 RepID=A0A2Z6E6K7_9GAMM|nr:TonB-dependent receptor [Aerosticca soli]BBD80805.1 TonB-dependent receptor [Aerosticca soli]